MSLTQVSQINLESEISAMCTVSELDLVYITLYDAPHFSLNVLHFSKDQDDLQLLARMPLAAVLESA